VTGRVGPPGSGWNLLPMFRKLSLRRIGFEPAYKLTNIASPTSGPVRLQQFGESAPRNGKLVCASR